MIDIFIPTLILTLGVLALVILGFAIKMVFKKDGEFKGGCAANNPLLTNQIGECQVCGAKPGDACLGDEEDQKGNEAFPAIG